MRDKITFSIWTDAEALYLQNLYQNLGFTVFLLHQLVFLRFHNEFTLCSRYITVSITASLEQENTPYEFQPKE